MLFIMDCKEMILSENVYDIITDFPLEGLELGEQPCYVDAGEGYTIVYVDRTGVPGPETDFSDYQTIPKLYGLMQIRENSMQFDPNNLIASGITQVQRPPLSLTGRGVVVCIIDTGIDYTHPAFWDENGNSRILAIWDQTIQEGTPPEGFVYGTEYRREDINRALRAENPYSIVPSRDENGHGSAMAGVAAGSNVPGRSTGTIGGVGPDSLRTSGPYLGAAPEADIVVVKLKECKEYLRRFYLVPDGVPAYQENDIMLGVKYADSFARLFTRPVVICLGLGTNMGDHAGSSALSRYLDSIAIRRSRAVVVGGGNEGNAGHHYYGKLTEEETTVDVEIRVGDGSIGFWLELWGNLPDVFTVSIRTPGGETISPLRLNTQQSITYDFVYERSRVTVDATLVEASSGEELLLFRVQNPTPGIWTFRVSAIGTVYNGQFNMWLPITEFLNTQIYFLNPNPYTTLTEPAMASEVISVSAYNAENNSFYIESGRGFTRDNGIRPDLSAPGVNVSTIYGRDTGSSLASAITAGAVAQFMQWAVVESNDEFAEGRQIKSFLIRGAERSADLNYPNRDWGYGRLNLEETFNVMTNV